MSQQSPAVASDRVMVGSRPAALIGPIGSTGRAVVIFDDRPNQPVVVDLSSVERVDAATPTYRHRESRA